MPFLSGQTVNDRVKQTGYMMGRNHRMGPAFDEAAKPAPSTAPPGDAAAPAGPPNLRDAATVPDSCADCAAFDGAGKCDKFTTSVTPNQVCDEFEKGQDDNGEETGTQGPGPEVSEVPPEAR